MLVQIIIILFAIIFLVLAVLILLFPKPIPITGCALTPPYFAQPDCVYVTETKYSKKILYPDNQSATLTLVSFVNNPNSNFGPFCHGAWYAYRFVNEQGEYGPLSSWYGPIKSGCTLPNGDIAPTNANSVTLGLVGTIELSLQNNFYINIHRYYGDTPPSSTEEGNIVGILPAATSDEPPSSYQFTDAFYPTESLGTICSGPC